MKEATKATWLARVDAWQRSGQSAAEFTADKPYKGTTLVWRAWQLRRRSAEPMKKKRADAERRVASKTAPRIALAEVVRRAPDQGTSARVTVEVDGARIAVARGFDATLLREVVQALGGAR